MQHAHTLLKILQIWCTQLLLCHFQQQRNMIREAVQLENISPTNDGGTLAYRLK